LTPIFGIFEGKKRILPEAMCGFAGAAGLAPEARAKRLFQIQNCGLNGSPGGRVKFFGSKFGDANGSQLVFHASWEKCAQ